MNEKLHKSAIICLHNGRRLMEEAEFLGFAEPPMTAYFLLQIAQEEFAKTFLLAFVERGIIPWDKRLLRAARNHSCKQLLCLIMSYLSPDCEEFVDRCNAVVQHHETPKLPPKVVDAINILRHEKLRRWANNRWFWEDDPEYDQEALSISEGKQDKVKQDLIYVRLGEDGSTASAPGGIAPESLSSERERTLRIGQLAENTLMGKDHLGLDYEQVEHIFRLLFESLTLDET